MMMSSCYQTQTEGVGAHSPRQMNNPDLSTRLKLMGVDVASFGDYFADVRSAKEPQLPPIDSNGEVRINDKPSKRQAALDGAVKCLTYHDPFSATYKKYIFTADGTRLIGGMMIGDVGSFTKLVAMTKSKVSLQFSGLNGFWEWEWALTTMQKKLVVPPSEFILGAKKAEDDDGADLDDEATICSCHVSYEFDGVTTCQGPVS